jgi:uncharacterized repeat protein (TIGR01451 family)/fimbrial isopeptide formation D2 family protein
VIGLDAESAQSHSVLFPHAPAPGAKTTALRRRIVPLSFLIAFLFSLPAGGGIPAAAAPRFAIPPSVSLDLPAEAMLGAQVSFTATFDNNDPSGDEGYGPFLELIIPRTGADGDDGLGGSLLTASYMGSPISAGDFYAVTFNGLGEALHPIVRNSSGDHITVTGSPGDTLVVVRLPFGSFSVDQPPATVTFTADLSALADLGVPLTVRARGGYEFGYTPLDDWCCGDSPDLTLGAYASGSVTPTLMTLAKTYAGPEDETATGPNYTRRYTLSVDIAPGQTIGDLTLSDSLPNNEQYAGLDSATAGYILAAEPAPGAPHNSPDNDLVLEWTAVTGGAGTADAQAQFSFFVPRTDADGDSVVDPATGAAAASCNNASASGTWIPLDPRDRPGPTDPPITVTIAPAGCEHTLADRSLAVQKTVSVPAGGYRAGAVVDYQLEIQISDFFAFDDAVLADVLSDGQEFVSAPAPTLAVEGNGYSLAAQAIDSANYTYTGTHLAPLGTTSLVVRISDEIRTRGESGLLIGGCISLTTPRTVDCGAVNDGPTTVVVRFSAVILENFVLYYPSGDISVDQGDEFHDTATIQGDVLANDDLFTPTGATAGDGSAADFVIGPGSLIKTIYAINGSTSFSTPAEVKPGDAVTYRIRYTMPVSDEENLALQDYLPLPVFSVTDWNGDGAPDGPWQFDYVGQQGQPIVIPAAGHANFGPADTFYAYTGNRPLAAFTADAGHNRLSFVYGDFDDPRDQSTTVDLLFTVTVTTEPFADRMYLTNQAHAIEGSTNAGEVAADQINQVIVTEPVIVGTKGVIWTSNPANVYAPANRGPAGVTFLDPANSPRWTGLINSSGLEARPIDSDVRDVDAGDTVTFAVTIHNTGSSLNGAFDIQIRDVLQSQYVDPSGAGTLNLQVYYGDGSGPIPYRGLTSGCTATTDGDSCGEDLFQGGIELIDPVGEGVCSAHNPNLGNDIILITYDLQIRNDVSPGNITNTETLLRYAGAEGGPNHVSPSAPETNSAVVAISGAPAKYIVATSQSFTGFSGMEEAAIGEVIRYRIAARIPESTSVNFQFRDVLPGGLEYLDDGTARVAFVSNLGIASADYDGIPAIPGGCNLTGTAADATTPATLPCLLDDWNVGSDFDTAADPDAYGAGTNVYFKLGDLTNSDRDDDGEYVVVEFNALVHNLPGANQNDSGDVWNNSVRAYAGAPRQQIGSPSPNLPVRIVEARLQVAKTVDDPDPVPGQTVRFTIVVDSAAAGNTTAFDVEVYDTLPAGLALDPGSITAAASGGLTGVSNASAGSLLYFSIDSFPTGGSLTIEYEAEVTAAFGSALDNTANVTWTSLPGFNANERTGAEGPGGTLNDYAAADTITLDVDRDLVKTLVGDSHPAPVTALPDAAIGEILTYQLVVTVPPTSTDAYTVIDTLDSGLAFVDCADITAGADLSSSRIDLHAAGNCSAGDVPGSNPLVTGSGTRVAYDFGTVVNAGASAESITIRYRAVVLDTTANAGGIELLNTAVMQWTTGSATRQSAPVRIIESDLGLEKTVDNTVATLGMILTYRIRIFHTPASDFAAYDAVVNDILPDGLTYVPGSLAFVGGSGVAPTALDDTGVDPASGNTVLRAVWDEIPVGGESTIEFQAAFGLLPPSAVVSNTATAEWTSLPGEVPAPPATYLSFFNQPYSHERRYDPLFPADVYRVSAARAVSAAAPPDTGFAPDVVTRLPLQPAEKRHTWLGDLRLQIPRLNKILPIVGIPLTRDGWDLTWLSDQAGYLEGTAFPGTAGNSVLTAHVYLSDGLPGPFLYLNTLQYGDPVILWMDGRQYVFEVRTNTAILPTDNSPFRHEDLPWLTLITCRGYNPYTGTYGYRQVARAVLVTIR